MLLYVSDFPQIKHDHYQKPKVEYNVTDTQAGMQFTGNFRFLVKPGHEPQLQQQYIERRTYDLKWLNIPFVHIKK